MSAVSAAESASSTVTTHDAVAELSHDFRLANGRLARRLRQQQAGNEVTPGQFSALCALFTHGSLTLGELSEQERVTPPSMNRTVNALVEFGLVMRTNSADDGRKVVLSPSDEGSDLVLKTRERRDAWITQRVVKLTTHEQQILAEATTIMRRLAES
ncbi:MarR family winged helix-turn-helix transcriptional regulator [Leifsonia sp. A12D58]|uniref:MarR family winged helix-turn-helix transcriptional regulator n=1 Tax=Leifsonia sp. A12D58 TaxID=3397674 RepID=UPI0039E19146